MFACLLSLVPVSQVEVGCPWARGLRLQLHPKVEEHPQAYQPATQPRVPLCPAPHPTIAPVILRLKQGKNKSQEGGGDPKPRKQREGGEPRETLHYLHY